MEYRCPFCEDFEASQDFEIEIRWNECPDYQEEEVDSVFPPERGVGS